MTHETCREVNMVGYAGPLKLKLITADWWNGGVAAWTLYQRV